MDIKKRNAGISLLKGISCILVVFMHCRFPGWFGPMISYVCRFPVSIFFMISGFYGVDKVDRWVRKKALYLFKLIVIMESFYLVLNTIVNTSNGQRLSSYVLSVFENTSLLEAVFFGPLFGGPLWYLYAAFWTWICILLFRRLSPKGESSFFFLIPLLLIIAIIGRNYCSRFTDPEKTIFVFRSALFYGLPFSLLGSYLKELLKSLGKLSSKKAVINCTIGSFLIVIEYLIAQVIHDFQLSTVFISVGLFVIFYNLREGVPFLKWLSYIGEKLSTWVYLLHVAFRTIVDQIALKIGVIDSALFNWARPIIILLLTLMFSALVSIIIDRVKGVYEKG